MENRENGMSHEPDAKQHIEISRHIGTYLSGVVVHNWFEVFDNHLTHLTEA